MRAVESKDSGFSTVAESEGDSGGLGLGLFYRFLGAVFLVLVCGLLLLDRALLQANHDQTHLDAQAASLLTEAFITEETALGERLGANVRKNAVSGRLELPEEILSAIRQRTDLNGVWITDSNGSSIVLAQGDSAQVIAAIQKIKRNNIGTISAVGRVHSIVITQEILITGVRVGALGLVVKAEELRRELSRLDIPTRVTLSVLAGADTVVLLGALDRSNQALNEAGRTIKLPNGGTWLLSATHALTSRNLRWAVWALGLLGAAFLAHGLLREQRRALHAAGRSSELERLYSDVKRANQAKSEFLANVSHELRTPLNAIVGFVELLREGFYGDLSPRQIPPVDRIAASATHLRHLVDQVLDIAKIAAGRLEVHAETIVLRPFVLNIASELESLVSEKGLTFSITVGASLPRVRTDPSHLRQILINLIGNAVKYTQNGTISIRARLVMNAVRMAAAVGDGEEKIARAPKAGSWIALQIVDTGVGIAPGDRERIFDEFEQVNAGPRGDSMNRGTGLGLAISRRLARLLGGEISVESELGRGSTFTVWLAVNAADLIREPTLSPPEGTPTTA